ncbi:hypothetical protein MSIBF_A400001 [groundwater metagenome]|uniref:Uncharacterized protein n=1 Tax=groundwater metagenome TaxID=717931 RepID=A0A098ED78_9ZZZZ
MQFAGFEILSALACHLGIFSVWSNTIVEHIENVKELTSLKKINIRVQITHLNEIKES